ncbi:hypothetical protein C8J57DRAFT_1184620 [Mycena rebaudengoi]|nr:hypothetical protein C8J57DRAFT_1184620 [Mycena rebaudengoi]
MRKKRAPTRPSPEPSDVDQESVFEIMIQTYPSVRKMVGKKKAPKPEASSHGPIEANTDMSWEDLLSAMAGELGTDPAFLVISSCEWRWIKPNNSVFLPLRTESGFKSLLKQLRAPPKNVSGQYILVKMDEPVRKPAAVKMPWSQDIAGPSPAFNYGGLDDDVFDDDDSRKKVPFDEGLADEIDKISDMYHPGVCSVHPTIECFHSRLNDLHFELDRNKKVVRAAAIKKGTASLLKAPVGSQHFSLKSSIKTKNSGSAAVPEAGPSKPAPETPVAPFPMWPNAYPYPPTPQPTHLGYPPQPTPPGYPPQHTAAGYSPFLPMGYPPPFPSYHPPGFYGHPSHMSTWEGTPRRREREWDDSSPPRKSAKRLREGRAPDPPSSPAVSGGSLDEFIEANPTLPAGLKSFLDDLGFQIGDDLAVVPEEQWKAAGFLLFRWAQVLKAYNKCKSSLR